MSTFYVEQADLVGLIPAPFLVQALDDDRDGQADPAAWSSVQVSACNAVDGHLGSRFEVPFQPPVPAIVLHAAKIFACEMLYSRRGYHGQQNPFTTQADELRKQLTKIGNGELGLAPDRARVAPSVSIITEPARTTSAQGRLAV
jgi:phage gp36-like protein